MTATETRGLTARRILALGVPLSGMMLLFRLMGAVDIAFVAPLGKSAWAAPFVLVDASSRAFVIGFKRPQVITAIMVIANLVNAIGDWALVYGHLGAPALGVTGAAWSTTIVYATMSIFTITYIVR